MKHLIYILFFALASCTETAHELRYKPDGTDSVVFVRYFDGKQFTTFYLPYTQFKELYNEGGYEGCYDYRKAHELPTYWQREYSKYKRH